MPVSNDDIKYIDRIEVDCEFDVLKGADGRLTLSKLTLSPGICAREWRQGQVPLSAPSFAQALGIAELPWMTAETLKEPRARARAAPPAATRAGLPVKWPTQPPSLPLSAYTVLLNVRHMERGGLVCFSAAGPLTEAILNNGFQTFENTVRMPDAESAAPWRFVLDSDGEMIDEDDAHVSLQLDLVMVRNVDGAVANLSRGQPMVEWEDPADENYDRVANFYADGYPSNLSRWINWENGGDILVFVGCLRGEDCHDVTQRKPWRCFHLRCHVIHWGEGQQFYFDSAAGAAHALAMLPWVR